MIEDQVTQLKTKLDAEEIPVSEACLRDTLTDLLDHPDPGELTAKMQQIATRSEDLLPALTKIFLESGAII